MAESAPGTGKLKSIKGNSTLRRLKGQGKGRPNPYERGLESPDKPSTSSKPSEALGKAISPRRKDKKQQQNAEQKNQEAGPSSQPAERRQTRSRLSVPEANTNERSSPKTPRRSPRNHDSDVVPTASQSGGGPSFTTPGSGRHSARDHEVIEDEDGPLLNEEAHATIAEETSGPATVVLPGATGKKPRGRPRKSKADDAKVEVNSPEKKRRGRPSKGKQQTEEHTPEEQPSAEEVQDVPRGLASKEPPSNSRRESMDSKMTPRAVRIRESQVHFEGNQNALADTILEEEQGSDVQREQGTKRKASASSQNGSTRRTKKTKTVQRPANGAEANEAEANEAEASDTENESQGRADVQHNGADGPDEDDDSIDKRRFFGVGWRLDKIYDNLDRVGVSHQDGRRIRANVSRDNADVKAIHKLCNRATGHLTRLQDDEEDTESLPDPPEQFEDIREMVETLSGHKPDSPINTKDVDKCAQIYFHVIPRLVRLLKHTIESYEAIDAHEAFITMVHQKTVIDLIAVILDMGNGANVYERPKGLRVVAPVKNNILPPLKIVQKELSRSLWSREQAQITARRRELQAMEDARQQKEEEQERKQREVEEKLRSLWRHLHDERRYVEGMVPAAKSFHLRIPDAAVEIDQDGEAFERLSMFGRRVGPHPAHVEKAREHVWALKEIEALRTGLRKYAGDGVFRDIFREHCVRGGVLNKYNVTEIVTIAADFKRHLQKEQMKEKGEVEEWVDKIPMWTQPHTILGQENAI